MPGVLPGNVLVLGGGTAGINGGRVAAGMGAHVTILEVDIEKMRFLDISLHGEADTLHSNEQNLLEMLPEGRLAHRRRPPARCKGAKVDPAGVSQGDEGRIRLRRHRH